MSEAAAAGFPPPFPRIRRRSRPFDAAQLALQRDLLLLRHLQFWLPSAAKVRIAAICTSLAEICARRRAVTSMKSVPGFPPGQARLFSRPLPCRHLRANQILLRLHELLLETRRWREAEVTARTLSWLRQLVDVRVGQLSRKLGVLVVFDLYCDYSASAGNDRSPHFE